MVVLTLLLFSTIILLVIIKYLVTVLHEHPSIFCTFENKERDLLLFLGKSRTRIAQQGCSSEAG